MVVGHAVHTGDILECINRQFHGSGVFTGSLIPGGKGCFSYAERDKDMGETGKETLFCCLWGPGGYRHMLNSLVWSDTAISRRECGNDPLCEWDACLWR